MSKSRTFDPFARHTVIIGNERASDSPSSYTGDFSNLRTRRAVMTGGTYEQIFLDEGGGCWPVPRIYAVYTPDGSFCTYVDAIMDEEALAVVMLARHFPFYVPHRARDFFEKRRVALSTLLVSSEMQEVLNQTAEIKRWIADTVGESGSVCTIDLDTPLDQFDAAADVVVHVPFYGVWFKNENDAIHFKLRWGR